MLYVFNTHSLRYSESGRARVISAGDQIAYPDVFSQLQKIKREGNMVFGFAEHPEVSFSERTELQAWAIEHEFNMMLGNIFNEIRINCYAPDGPKRFKHPDLRSPKPMLIEEIKMDLGVAECIIISDREVDQALAKNVSNCSFNWTWNFFPWDKSKMERVDDKYIWPKSVLEGETLKSNRKVLTIFNSGKSIGKRIIPRDCIVHVPEGVALATSEEIAKARS